jgi:surface antigen
MSKGRIFLILVALGVSSTIALAMRSETSYEEVVQYSLEHLASGVSTAFLASGNKVTIVPLRTWKSVSGHYCRQYETTVTVRASAPSRIGSIRCRDGNGIWKRVKKD